MPGIISRPDSRDSYTNIQENIPESHFDKNICIFKIPQQISGLVLPRKYTFREEARPIFQIADLAI